MGKPITPSKRYSFGSLRFRIVLVPDVLKYCKEIGVEDESGEDDLDGIWLPSRSIIVVGTNQSKEQQRSTVLHELLHACGIDDERIVLRYEIMLFPVLRKQGWDPLADICE